jgi:hypothetical protein
MMIIQALHLTAAACSVFTFKVSPAAAAGELGRSALSRWFLRLSFAGLCGEERP